MVVVHDRILYYAEKNIIEDEYGEIEQTAFETDGVAVPVKLSDGTFRIVVKKDDKTIMEIVVKGPVDGYIGSKYIDKPDSSRAIPLTTTMVDYGILLSVKAKPSSPYLVVARGRIDRELRIMTRSKEWIFRPIDVDGDGYGFRAVFIIGEKIYGEDVFIEHNGLDVKVYGLSADIINLFFDAEIEIWEAM